MKKSLLLLSAIAITCSLGRLNAQTIINPCFDNWTHTSAGGFNPVPYDDPNPGLNQNGWLTLNVTSSSLLGSSPVSVFKDSTTPSPYAPCKYSARIVTTQLSHATNVMIAKYLPDTIIGLLAAGQEQSTPKLIFGYPFTTRITQLSFYFQYSPVGTDTAAARVNLKSKYGHVLGAGIFTVSANTSSWTLGTVNVTYDSATGTPDTINVVFSSSSWHKPNAGSQLWVDNVTVTPNVVSNLFARSSTVEVYPNPASSEVNFNVNGNPGEEYILDVYDITGKKMTSFPVRNNFASLTTANYSAGLYIYRLSAHDGTQISMGKFSVVK